MKNMNQNFTVLLSPISNKERHLTFDSIQARITPEGGEPFFLTSESDSSIDITNLQPNTTYTCQVCRRSVENGNGLWSPTFTFTTQNTFVPLHEVDKLLPVNGSAGDNFSRNIACSKDGALLAVGARGYNEGRGAVYTYHKTPEGLIQDSFLTIPESQPGDFFGYAISISGDGSWMVVSSTNRDENRGKVYLYQRVEDIWVYSTSFESDTAARNQYYGWSVHLNHQGTQLYVGARNDSTYANGNGAVKCYRREPNTAVWEFETTLFASDPETGAYFGQVVEASPDGEVVIVSAPYKTHLASFSGVVYVFRRSQAELTEETMIGIEIPTPIAWFGTSIAVRPDGKMFAVGATGINASQGSVFIYEYIEGSWILSQTLVPENLGSGTHFMTNSLQFSEDGQSLVVGLHGTSVMGKGAGAVNLYQLEEGVFTLAQTVFASDPTQNDYFGFSVAGDTDLKTIYVGAYREDTIGTDAGAVYVFRE